MVKVELTSELINELLSKDNIPEYHGKVVISSETTDRNGHLNHADYLRLCEGQRGLFVASRGLSIGDIASIYKLTSMISELWIRYPQELLLNDEADIYTGAVRSDFHLLFRQRMLRGNDVAANLICSVRLVDMDSRRIRRRSADRVIQRILNTDFNK